MGPYGISNKRTTGWPSPERSGTESGVSGPQCCLQIPGEMAGPIHSPRDGGTCKLQAAAAS